MPWSCFGLISHHNEIVRHFQSLSSIFYINIGTCSWVLTNICILKLVEWSDNISCKWIVFDNELINLLINYKLNYCHD